MGDNDGGGAAAVGAQCHLQFRYQYRAKSVGVVCLLFVFELLVYWGCRC